MLVDRLEYLINNKLIDGSKTMIEYENYLVSYKFFLDLLDRISLIDEFKVSDEISYIHYKTKSPLITLIMFYYYTSLGFIYVMLPTDIGHINNILDDENMILIEGYDDIINSIIKGSTKRELDDQYSESKKFDGIIKYRKNNSHNSQDDLFLRAYSSGTSGMRKQLERNYKSWFDAFEMQNEIFGVSKSSIVYLKGDINYTGNLNYALAVIYAGGTVLISNKRGVRDLVELIDIGKINNVFLVPTVLGIVSRYLEKADTSKEFYKKNITIVTAGEKLQEFVYREIRNKLKSAKIIEYYGASEVGHISYSVDDEILIGDGYVGRAFDNVSIKVIDGKVYTHSPYHATRHEGYICAGDYGSYTEGNLYIFGRGKGVISRSAKMINTEEIRAIVSKQLACECYSFKYQDKKRGENYILILKSNKESIKVKEEVDSLVEKVSRPERIFVVNEIKTKDSGKVDYSYYHSRINTDLTDY